MSSITGARAREGGGGGGERKEDDRSGGGGGERGVVPLLNSIVDLCLVHGVDETCVRDQEVQAVSFTELACNAIETISVHVYIS